MINYKWENYDWFKNWDKAIIPVLWFRGIPSSWFLRRDPYHKLPRSNRLVCLKFAELQIPTKFIWTPSSIFFHSCPCQTIGTRILNTFRYEELSSTSNTLQIHCNWSFRSCQYRLSPSGLLIHSERYFHVDGRRRFWVRLLWCIHRSWYRSVWTKVPVHEFVFRGFVKR